MIPRKFALVKKYSTLDGLTDVDVGTVADAQLLEYDSATGMWGPVTRRLAVNTPGAIFGDGNDTATVTAGLTGYIRVPYAGTITRWDIVSDVAVTCQIDVWKAAGAVPTVANKISGSSGVFLTAAQVNTSSALGAWTTTVTAGDVFGFYLASVSGGSPTQIVVTLEVS